MDVLSSRVLLHPTDPERSRTFYRDTLGLAIYREFGSGPDRGTVFFLGGGFPPGRTIRARRGPSSRLLGHGEESVPHPVSRDADLRRQALRQVRSNISTLTVSVERSRTTTTSALMRSPASLDRISVCLNTTCCPFSTFV